MKDEERRVREYLEDVVIHKFNTRLVALYGYAMPEKILMKPNGEIKMIYDEKTQNTIDSILKLKAQYIKANYSDLVKMDE